MEAQLHQILNDGFETKSVKMAIEMNISSRVTKNAIDLTSPDNFRWNVLRLSSKTDFHLHQSGVDAMSNNNFEL